jgi:hypothetical protein
MIGLDELSKTGTLVFLSIIFTLIYFCYIVFSAQPLQESRKQFNLRSILNFNEQLFHMNKEYGGVFFIVCTRHANCTIETIVAVVAVFIINNYY